MEKTNFDQLLQRYLSGEVSEAERIKIEAWLEEKKTEGADIELSKEDEEKIFSRITGNITHDTPIRRARQVPFTRWTIGIAAALVTVIAVSYMFYAGNVTTTRPDNEKMILNDGSIVWLRGQSKLTYFEGPQENIRYAEFSGEALFEVSKDPSKPFEIHCGEMTIRVLGTSFSLKSMNDSLELEVLTGKVHISSSKENEGVDVEPNQKVIYAGGDIVKAPMKAEDVSAITARTEYDMQFTNTTMIEVLARVGKKFNVKITLDNPQAGQCRLTGDFTDHSLESTLHMIAEVLEVEYTIQNNTINITGNGCK